MIKIQEIVNHRIYRLEYEYAGHTSCHASITTSGDIEEKSDSFIDIDLEMPGMKITFDNDKIHFHVDHPEEVRNIHDIAEAFINVLSPIVRL